MEVTVNIQDAEAQPSACHAAGGQLDSVLNDCPGYNGEIHPVETITKNQSDHRTPLGPLGSLELPTVVCTVGFNHRDGLADDGEIYYKMLGIPSSIGRNIM